ncbi:b(0,+)-type amino acid transporter 1 isoform X2 [Hydra vulgaris]|uniref:B(0,+)-type amino acid transporter 1 isoform X2 n=1 Tax=Hydra vulgaris TaxID=6087 RepID=A0ABM4CKS5_HYDVU
MKLEKDQELVALNTTEEHSLTEQINVKLEKNVSVLGGVGLIVGSIIGSGIFLSPSSVLIKSGSIGLSLIVWVLSGFISLLGALCYGELGTSIPRSGAEHAYLLAAFGPIPAFLFSWTATLVIRPSAGAIIAMIFAQYVVEPFYKKEEKVPDYVIKLLSFFCIVLIATVNCLSVKLAVAIQNIFTFAKLSCVAMLIVIGFIELGKGNTTSFKDSFNGTTTDAGQLSLAFYFGLWAYDGWNSLNYVTEEMQNPSRQMPLAITISMVLVMGCYLLCNIAYIAVLGPIFIKSSSAVALDLGNRYLGVGKFVVPVLVGLSCFGAVNGLLFTSGRLVYVAARERHMPKFLAMIHVKRKTPLPSLIFTALISVLMLIPKASKFESLVGIFSFASWLFYGLCFLVLIFLRFKRKDLRRPYKVFLPIPVIMILVSICLTALPFYEDWLGSLVALFLIFLGVPVYYMFVKINIFEKFSICLNTPDFTTVLLKYGLAFPDDEPAL